MIPLQESDKYYALTNCTRYKQFNISNGVINQTGDNILLGPDYTYSHELGSNIHTFTLIPSALPRVYTSNNNKVTLTSPNTQIYYSNNIDVSSSSGTISEISSLNIHASSVDIWEGIEGTLNEPYGNISELLSVRPNPEQQIQGIIVGISTN